MRSYNLKHGIFSVAVILSLLLALAPNAGENVYAAGDGAISVIVSYQKDDSGFAIPRQELSVEPGLANSYGYTNDSSIGQGEISAMDVLVATEIRYTFGGTPPSVAQMNDALVFSSGFIMKLLGGDSDGNYSYSVNGESPSDGIYQPDPWNGGNAATGLSFTQAKVGNGDRVEFYDMQDDWAMDTKSWFEHEGRPAQRISANAGEAFNLTLKGYMSYYSFSDPGTKAQHTSPIEDAAIVAVDKATGKFGLPLLTTGTDGVASLTLPVGEYVISAYDTAGNFPLMSPWIEVSVTDGRNLGSDWHHLTKLNFLGGKGALSPAWDRDVTDYIYEVSDAVSTLRLSSEVPNQYTKVTYTADARVYLDGDLIPIKEGLVIAVKSSYSEGSPFDEKVYNITIHQVGGNAQTITAGLPNADDLRTEVIDKIAGYEKSTVVNPTAGDEWTVIALARGGYVTEAYKETYLSNLIKILKERNGVLTGSRKYTEYSRTCLAISALGENPIDVGGYNLLKPLAEFENVVYQGINGPAYALLALDSGGYAVPILPQGTPYTQTTRERLVDYLLTNQRSDGMWTLAGGMDDIPNVDITAMVLQALAPYCNDSMSAQGFSKLSASSNSAAALFTPADVRSAVDRALTVLKGAQDGVTGSFGNAGTNAQVLVALTALGISPGKADYLKGADQTVYNALMNDYLGTPAAFRLSAGASSPDRMFTDQGFCATIALYRHLVGMNSLYAMGDGISLAQDVRIDGNNSPKTGDDTMLQMYAFIAVCALSVLIAIGLRRISREKHYRKGSNQ